VADRGQVAALRRGMAEPAGELGRAFPARGVDDVGSPLLDGDARGLEAVGGERGELVFEGWSPAELVEQRESPLQPESAGARLQASTGPVSGSRNRPPGHG